MRTRSIRVTVAWLTVAAGMMIPGYGAENLVTNGDFSAGAKGWQLQVKDPARTGITVQKGELVLTRGVYGKPGVPFFRAYQDIPVRFGARYILSCRTRVSGKGETSAWLHWGDRRNKWTKGVSLFSCSSSRWRTVRVSLVPPPGTDKIRINFTVNAFAQKGFYDDIVLEEIFSARTATIPLVSGALNLDGNLSEPLWQKAALIDDFRVLDQPHTPAPVKSEVRLAVSGNDLVVGVRMHEPNPRRMKLLNRKDGIGVFGDDCFEMFLSPDQKSFVHFLVNALGSKGVEIKVHNTISQTWYSGTKHDYAGAWKAAARIHGNEWFLEISIDLRDLWQELDIKQPVLFANFCRHRPQEKPVYSNWAGITGKTFHAPAQFQPLLLARAPVITNRTSVRKIPLPFTRELRAPKWLFAGNPVYMKPGRGIMTLPGSLQFTVRDCAIDAGVLGLIERGLTITGNAPMTVECSLWRRGRIPLRISRSMRAKLDSDEAFLLRILPDRAVVSGRTRDGVLRGLATLALLGSQAKSRRKRAIDCMTILDAPRLKFRGYMINGYRYEGLAAFRRQVDLLYLLRFNVVMFPTVPYGGPTQFPYATHPDIAGKHKQPSTKADWAAFADYARARGMQPIPFHHSWARAGYVLNNPVYSHLAVRPELKKGTLHGHSGDRNFCVSNPGSARVVFDLLGELVETMRLAGINITLDEVFYDDMVTNPLDRARGLTRSQYMVEVVTKTRNFLHSRGCRTYMWGDMLDPDQNGKQIDMSGPELLARLPRDVIILDWKYEGKFDNAAHFPSIKMFTDAGFTTIGCPWQTPGNMAGIVQEVYQDKAYGMLGTVWNDSRPAQLPAELVTVTALGAYLSWSPENCDLAEFPFAPALLYQAAAYNYGHEMPHAENVRQVDAPASVLTGDKLVKALAMPAWADPVFMRKPVTTRRGAEVRPFAGRDRTAGLVLGVSAKPVRLKVQGRVRFITFLHTVNRQNFSGNMHAMKKHFKGASPGTYVLHYADKTSAELPLEFRAHICDWNDRMLPRWAEPGWFGTVGGRLHVNIPVYTWKNPFPDKPVTSLEIRPGNREDMTLVILGVCVD